MARQAAVPPFALLEMPDQDLVRYTRKLKIAHPRIKTLLGRLVTFGGTREIYGLRGMANGSTDGPPPSREEAGIES